MADELRTNLASYKLQILQVDASLENDPENEDLLKLKYDLQEVIDLTVELHNQQKDKSDHAQVETSTTNIQDGASNLEWSVGDKCMAMWSQDSQYYPAKIEEVLPDGSCTVTFATYDQTELTQVVLLKPYDEKSVKQTEMDNQAKNTKSKYDMQAQQREYKRKKSQKKAQRLKQIEEDHESDKNKWIDFNVKTFSKTSKGRVKKSIFATSEHVKGRVGVGTCGVSGKPMTNYVTQKLKRTK